jgi:hypothetical protein
VSEEPSPQLRISDIDRESALQALGEHMSVGRIDLDEYGDRSAKVTAAKTRGELAEIFADLPQPHPQMGAAPAAAPAAPGATEVQPAPGHHPTWAERPLNQRLTATIVPVVWVIAIALVSVGAGWWWIIAPILLTSFGRQLWGHGWNNGGDHDGDHRERRLDILDSQRDRREDLRDRRDSRRDYRDDRRDRRRR